MIELIDERNQKLWNEIRETHHVEFNYSSRVEYSCYSEGTNITFFVNSDNLCKDSFTHEMLHVYLRIKGFYFGGSITNLFAGHRLLSTTISEELIEHIGNCLDHIKMLPIYLDMGFEREKFLLDYDLYKCTQEEINLFKKFYRTGNKINIQAVDSYIGRLVSILADPNEKFNYSKDLENLKKIDPLLFQIVERLINHTKEIRVENREFLEDDYLTVTGNFYENLKKWIAHNKLHS